MRKWDKEVGVLAARRIHVMQSAVLSAAQRSRRAESKGAISGAARKKSKHVSCATHCSGHVLVRQVREKALVQAGLCIRVQGKTCFVRNVQHVAHFELRNYGASEQSIPEVVPVGELHGGAWVFLYERFWDGLVFF